MEVINPKVIQCLVSQAIKGKIHIPNVQSKKLQAVIRALNPPDACSNTEIVNLKN